MKNKCEICGKSAESNRCFLHKPHSLKSKTSLRRHKREATIEEKEKQVVDTERMYALFKSLYIKRGKKSEISDEDIYSLSSANVHHILLKEKHPEAKFDEENLILLTIDEHANVHLDMYKYEEINKRREFLKNKYNLL